MKEPRLLNSSNQGYNPKLTVSESMHQQTLQKGVQKPMTKPVILLVDPEPEVLSTIEGDLQRQYNGRFQIIQTDSSKLALKKLQNLPEQNDFVTLFVVEQSSKMTSIEFLKVVKEIFPKAKRFFLTSYDSDNIPTRLPLPKAVVV